jgi:isoleucyl-tRNA synthetase
MRRRMDDWLTNMADWCISRKRYWGLPLPFYPCSRCGHVTVVASRPELRERAVDPAAVDALPELHRPWIDDVAVRCSHCGHATRRVPEVGDCWLDAGIVPFSTLGYLEDRDRWAQWFPADFVVEAFPQIRGWFYAMLFMSVTLEGQAPYRTVMAHERVLGDDGREMHKSWGNAVWFDDAVQTMGADVIRYLFASTSVTEPIRFGESAAREVKRKFLTLWNVHRLFLTYARLDRPELAPDAAAPRVATGGLERWLLARLQSMVGEVGAALDAYQARRALTLLDDFVQQDLSNWYVRRRRRLFWKGEMDATKHEAYRTLHHVLVRVCQLLAPVTPFVTEHMYRTLVSAPSADAPSSVHLTSYPTPDPALVDRELEHGVALVRRVVSVGLAARNSARIKVRQPLSRAVAHAASGDIAWLRTFEDDVRDELNVESVELVTTPPEPGASVAVASEGGVTVALDIAVTPALARKGLVRHLVHQVQVLRKTAGLAVEQRITLFVATDAETRAAVIESRDYVVDETLAEALVFETPPPGAAVLAVELAGGRATLGVRAAG